jgi:hypothetical protein
MDRDGTGSRSEDHRRLVSGAHVTRLLLWLTSLTGWRECGTRSREGNSPTQRSDFFTLQGHRKFNSCNSCCSTPTLQSWSFAHGNVYPQRASPAHPIAPGPWTGPTTGASCARGLSSGASPPPHGGGPVQRQCTSTGPSRSQAASRLFDLLGRQISSSVVSFIMTSSFTLFISFYCGVLSSY